MAQTGERTLYVSSAWPLRIADGPNLATRCNPATLMETRIDTPYVGSNLECHHFAIHAGENVHKTAPFMVI